MKSVLDELPATDGLSSKPVLFVVDGKRYAGHYHINGWFYCDEWGGNHQMRMAAGPAAKDVGFYRPEDVLHYVTEWEYLRSE
jgi:hypothetical protein